MFESPLLITSKYYLGVLSGYLLFIGASIEPSVGVWIVSVAGALLTASLGRDRSINGFFLHIFIGLGWGVFGSQIVHHFLNINQVSISFFTGMFGVEGTWFFIRNFRTGNLVEYIEAVRGGKGKREADDE